MKPIARLSPHVFKPIDERVYALVRITFACILVIHIAALWPYRLTLFSPDGLVPMDVDGNGRYFSVFAFLQSNAAIAGYFCFSAFMAALLALGVVPRLAALAVMVWLASYNNHLSFVGYGADFVMRVFGFLVLISPLGACWALGSRSPLPAEVPQYGILLMRLQLAVIYFDTALAKLFSAPWRNGEAFSQFLLSVYSNWSSPLFIDWLWLSKIATYSALLLEFALPILLFIPRTRLAAIGIGLGFHVLITLASPSLILFSLAMLPGYLAFLDGASIERLTGLFRGRRRERARAAAN